MSTNGRHPSHPSRRENQSTSSNSSAQGSRSSRSQSGPAIESAVTRLLVSIKSLLETLTSWSTSKKTEDDVSNVYVRLGNDFNAAVAAFGMYNIDMSELMMVPDELRGVLEQCLAEEASKETLEVYLPDVRKIITKLLQGLRGKQSVYRQIMSDTKHRSSTSEGSTSSRPESRSSRSSRRDTGASTKSNPSNQQADVQSSDSLSRRTATSTRRKEAASMPYPPPPPTNGGDAFVGGFAPDIQRASTPAQPRREWSESAQRPPSRTSSATAVSSDAQHGGAASSPAADPTPLPVPRPPSSVPSHVKRYSLVDRPIPSPPPPSSPTPPPAVVVDEAPSVNGQGDAGSPPSPPFLDSPPDAPAVQSSLAALKQSDALERRASKRFSTYNISKMTGGSIRGMGNHPNRRSMAVSSALTPGDLAVLTEENEDEPTPRKRERTRTIPRSRNPSPILEDEEAPPPVPSLPPGTPSRGPSPQRMPKVAVDHKHRSPHHHYAHTKPLCILLHEINMPSFFDKLKPSSHKHQNQGEQQQQGEPTYSIQPHPAKTNDPRDLEPPQLGAGLNSNPEQEAFHTPGPYIPSDELRNSLPPPKSRDELKARSADLNK